MWFLIPAKLYSDFYFERSFFLDLFSSLISVWAKVSHLGWSLFVVRNLTWHQRCSEKSCAMIIWSMFGHLVLCSSFALQVIRRLIRVIRICRSYSKFAKVHHFYKLNGVLFNVFSRSIDFHGDLENNFFRSSRTCKGNAACQYRRKDTS